MSYQADSWANPRRVVLVVQEKPDDLFLHAFFIVTNLQEHECSAEQLLDLYRKRGKAEAHMGELKSTLDLHLPSTNTKLELRISKITIQTTVQDWSAASVKKLRFARPSALPSFG